MSTTVGSSTVRSTGTIIVGSSTTRASNEDLVVGTSTTRPSTTFTKNAVSGHANNAANNTAMTFPLPSASNGSGVAPAVGDPLYLAVVINQAVSVMVPTAPAGWTFFYPYTSMGTGAFYILARTGGYQSGDGTSVTVTVATYNGIVDYNYAAFTYDQTIWSGFGTAGTYTSRSSSISTNTAVAAGSTGNTIAVLAFEKSTNSSIPYVSSGTATPDTASASAAAASTGVWVGAYVASGGTANQILTYTSASSNGVAVQIPLVVAALGGAPALSGTGALSASAAGLWIAQPASTGTGTLALGVTMTATDAGASVFGGTGTSSAQSTSAWAAPVALSGTGTLGESAALSVAGNTASTGTGTLGMTGAPVMAAGASFGGSGALTATATQAIPSAVSFSGVGTVTSTASEAFSGSVPTSGSGALGLGAGFTTSQPVAFSGAGSMSVGTNTSGTSSAAFSGTGTSSGATSLTVTGAPSFSGVGAVTATSSPRVSGAVASSGVGTLTSAAALVMTGAVSTSGTGTLSSTGLVLSAGSSPFSGTGTVAAVSTPALTNTASLSGTGTTTLASLARESMAASLSGTGTATVAAATAGTNAAGLSGVGALTLATKVVVAGAMSLTGTGTMSLVITPVLTSSPTLSGTGTVASAAVARTSAAVSLTGVGTMSALGSTTGSIVLALSGIGTLAPAASSAVAVSTALSGTGSLALVTTPAVPTVTALSGAGSLAGTSELTQLMSAALSGTGTLSVAGAVPASAINVPQVRASSQSYVSTAGTAQTIAFPGTPQVGDPIGVWLTNGASITITPPTGWTVEYSQAVGTGWRFFMHKIYASSDGSSTVLTFSQQPIMAVGVIVFNGSVQNGFGTLGTITTRGISSVTTTAVATGSGANPNLVVSHEKTTGQTSITPDSGLTAIVSQLPITADAGSMFVGYYDDTTGVVTHTVTYGGTANVNGAAYQVPVDLITPNVATYSAGATFGGYGTLSANAEGTGLSSPGFSGAGSLGTGGVSGVLSTPSFSGVGTFASHQQSGVVAWLAGPKYVAHRGGDADNVQDTAYAYAQACAWNTGLALEVSVVRTSDGYYMLSDSLTTGANFNSNLTIGSSTKSQLAALRTTTGNYPPMFLDSDIIGVYSQNRVIFLDAKNSSSQAASELRAIADANGGPAWWVFKGAYNNSAWYTQATSGGYQSWGYWFPSDTSAGNLTSATQANWTMLGIEYDDTSAVWAQAVGYGKVVIGHVIANSTEATTARGLGATGLMVSGVREVIPQTIFTGPASFSGTGALASSATNMVGVAAAFGGGGTLTGAGVQGSQAVSTASGSGTLTASGPVLVTVSDAFSGSGSLSQLIMVRTGQNATLTGTGTVILASNRAIAASAATSSTGTLSMTGRDHVLGAVNYGGLGTLSGAELSRMADQVALSGLGTLTGAVGPPHTTRSLAYSGTGLLSVGTGSGRVYLRDTSGEWLPANVMQLGNDNVWRPRQITLFT